MCSFCGGPLMVLGRLGGLLHLCCRDCGSGFNMEVEDEDEAGGSSDAKS